jgi:hypothetical protein
MYRLNRAVATVLALSLSTVTAVGLVATPAGAATPGVGATQTKTTVVHVQLGQNGTLLNLTVLADNGGASIDPHNAPSAATSLNPLALTSGTLNLNLSAPTLSTQAPGGPTDTAGQAVNLATLGVPGALATGTIKAAALHSDYASTAAHSVMTAAEVDNLSLLGGGLLSVDLLSSTLGANALGTDANGARGVNVGTVKLLDLGALLKGLGIDPSALPVSTLGALLGQLGLAVPGLPAGVDLNTFVSQLQTSITSLQSTVNSAANTVTGTVDATTGGLLGGLGLPVPSVSSTVSQVTGVVNGVVDKLTALLAGALSALDTAPLVQVAATQVGVSTKAADTLAHSLATVSTAPLNITAVGLKLPTIDAGAVASTVNGVLNTANGALGNLLSTLGLPTNLVSLSLLDQATSLSVSGAYTQAVAGITALTARIAPIDPAAVTGAVAKLAGPSVASVLGGVGAALPSLPLVSAMASVGNLLHTAAPLTGGALVQVASLGGSSTYMLTTAAAAPGVPAHLPSTPAAPHTLPHTGANPALALLGVLVVVLGLAVARWRRALGAAPTS